RVHCRALGDDDEVGVNGALIEPDVEVGEQPALRRGGLGHTRLEVGRKALRTRGRSSPKKPMPTASVAAASRSQEGTSQRWVACGSLQVVQPFRLVRRSATASRMDASVARSRLIAAQYPSRENHPVVDVVVVGGGLAGLVSAWHL